MNQNSFQIVTWIPKCSTFRWFVSRWAPLKKLGSPGGQSVLPFHCYCPRNPPKQGPEKHVWWKCGRRPVGFKGWDCWQFHQILQLHIKIYPPQTLPIAPQNKTNIRIIELLLKIHVGGGGEESNPSSTDSFCLFFRRWVSWMNLFASGTRWDW